MSDRLAPERPRELTDAERRRAPARRVFGDVLPDRTRDERGDDGSGAARAGRGATTRPRSGCAARCPPHHGD